MREITPYGKRILARRKEDEAKTMSEGGIHFPDKAKDISQVCEVISVGSEVEGLAPGDEILVGKYNGVEFEFENRKYIILEPEQILVRITPEVAEEAEPPAPKRKESRRERAARTS
jgi:co-chaperonin GroES (HSP10)